MSRRTITGGDAGSSGPGTWRPSLRANRRLSGTLSDGPLAGWTGDRRGPAGRRRAGEYQMEPAVPGRPATHPVAAAPRRRAIPTMRIDGSGDLANLVDPARAGDAAPHRRPGGAIRSTAWGDGAEWAVAQVPELLGAGDDWSELGQLPAPAAGPHPTDRAGTSHSPHQPGFRVPGTGRAGAAGGRPGRPAVLAATGAPGSDRPRPGPRRPGMRVCPSAVEWGRIPSWEWHLAVSTRVGRPPSAQPPGWPPACSAPSTPDAADRP